MKIITSLLVVLLALGACTAQVETQEPQTPPISQPDEMILTSYGGFTTPETNQQTITITKDNVIMTLGYYQGEEEFRYERPLAPGEYEQAQELFTQQQFLALEELLNSDIPVTDVGKMKFTLRGEQSHSVEIDPALPEEYPAPIPTMGELFGKYSEELWNDYITQ